MPSYIKKCRNCYSKSIATLFDLGKFRFTGKFPKFNEKIPYGNLTLVMCKFCKLVQLKEIFNMKYLYNKDYGYRTGINSTMTNHVSSVVSILNKKSNLKSGDHVLDIASNDGTLLLNYKNKVLKWGIDPILKKFKNEYKSIDYKIPSFFNFKSINNKKKDVKFKIITALSVFYDLENPNKFLSDIHKILHKDGIFYLEFQDLLLILKRNMFDTICHEHLEYYSFTFVNKILKKHKLRIFDHNYNDINGGSAAYFICHENANLRSNTKKINKIIKDEKNIEIEEISTYKKFKKRIDKLKLDLNIIINKIIKRGETIHGYAASTKGNVLLQYYDLNNDNIKFISDRNPRKKNLYTPGTNIKIITESESRKMKPDYYLVLAWHFEKEILSREKLIRKKGTKFIFPLPKIKVV
jgi:ubiquinone/menaquinone biosynthesis C-methylase UbiE